MTGYVYVGAIGAPQVGPGVERWNRLEAFINANGATPPDHFDRPAGERRGFYRLDVASGRWDRLSDRIASDVMIRCVSIHPGNPAIVYAGGEKAVYRSEDHGDSWERLGFEGSEGVVWWIEFHPSDPNIMFIGTEGTTIYRTDDGGQSFRELSVPKPAGAPDTPFPMHVLRISIDPQAPDTIYAALEVGGIVRSLDGGESWADCGQNLLEIARAAHADRFPGSMDRLEDIMDSHSVLASPMNSGTLFLGNRLGLFKSEDRGSTWIDLGIDQFSKLYYTRDIHISSHDPATLFATFSNGYIDNAGSLYRSVDEGRNWTRLGEGLTIDSTLMAVQTSRISAGRLFCATYGGRIFGSEDLGRNWQSYQLPEGTVGVFGLAVS